MMADRLGQGLVEYGLILALTAVLTTVWLVVFGGTVSDALAAIAIAIDRATAAETSTGASERPPVPSSRCFLRRRLHIVAQPSTGVSTHPGGTCMALFNSFLATLRRDEEGQGLAEYALILALIAIIAIIALIFWATRSARS